MDLLSEISLKDTKRSDAFNTYTVLHMFAELLFWAGNQSNHQNFDPSLLPKNLWLTFMRIIGIGPWLSRIDWCKGHQFGSTDMVVRLSNIRPKTGKKCILSPFWAFESAILDFFIHPHENQSKIIGWQECVKILMITLVSSPKQHLPKRMQHSAHTSNH